MDLLKTHSGYGVKLNTAYAVLLPIGLLPGMIGGRLTGRGGVEPQSQPEELP